MSAIKITYHYICSLFILLLFSVSSFAQVSEEETVVADMPETLDNVANPEYVLLDTMHIQIADTSFVADIDTLVSDSTLGVLQGEMLVDAASLLEKPKFIPDPKKSMWLAMVFPGGGQIYNRKFWKLPIVYGGFLGCVYAMSWNNTMFRDYSQAYIDIMDTDENTKSYENFVPKRFDINSNMDRLKELFKRKKNFYRRYRDLSMFCMIGVYALSIIDAYVDAEMSSFDIGTDLSMKIQPAVIPDRYSAMRATGLNANSYGLQCSFNF